MNVRSTSQWRNGRFAYVRMLVEDFFRLHRYRNFFLRTVIIYVTYITSFFCPHVFDLHAVTAVSKHRCLLQSNTFVCHRINFGWTKSILFLLLLRRGGGDLFSVPKTRSCATGDLAFFKSISSASVVVFRPDIRCLHHVVVYFSLIILRNGVFGSF